MTWLIWEKRLGDTWRDMGDQVWEGPFCKDLGGK